MIFVPLPRLVGPTASPLFCPREGGIDESLLQVEFPPCLELLGQHAQDALQRAGPHPVLETAMAGLVRRILVGQFAPLRSGAQHPQNSVEHGSRLLPGSTTTVGPPRRS